MSDSPSHQVIRGFLSPAERARLEERVRAQAPLFRRTEGKRGLGPRYRVLDGHQVRAQLPEIEELGRSRVQPLLEEVAGQPLQPLDSAKRAVRVQWYDRPEDGFRWHFDAHAHAALLVLWNDNGGETQWIAEGLSRWLRPFVYALYPFPAVFSGLPRQSVRLEGGDLQLIRGDRLLHRGVSSRPGERLLLFWAFDPVGKRPSRVRDRVARLLNY